jgi:hypothetical protein
MCVAWVGGGLHLGTPPLRDLAPRPPPPTHPGPNGALHPTHMASRWQRQRSKPPGHVFLPRCLRRRGPIAPAWHLRVPCGPCEGRAVELPVVRPPWVPRRALPGVGSALVCVRARARHRSTLGRWRSPRTCWCATRPGPVAQRLGAPLSLRTWVLVWGTQGGGAWLRASDRTTRPCFILVPWGGGRGVWCDGGGRGA